MRSGCLIAVSAFAFKKRLSRKATTFEKRICCVFYDFLYVALLQRCDNSRPKIMFWLYGVEILHGSLRAEASVSEGESYLHQRSVRVVGDGKARKLAAVERKKQR